MLPPAFFPRRDILFAQRATAAFGGWEGAFAVLGLHVGIVDVDSDGFFAVLTLLVCTLHLTFFQKVLVDSWDLYHLLTLCTRGQHRARLPVVHIQLLFREGRVLNAAELAEPCCGLFSDILLHVFACPSFFGFVATTLLLLSGGWRAEGLQRSTFVIEVGGDGVDDPRLHVLHERAHSLGPYYLLASHHQVHHTISHSLVSVVHVRSGKVHHFP
mmetsp:Transcript_3481/g.5120  ORF Transcript_3481/g.5120 Transcript_3481/m.5120 type:complete len:214 (-) Transcript_3481:790-1431(-)